MSTRDDDDRPLTRRGFHAMVEMAAGRVALAALGKVPADEISRVADALDSVSWLTWRQVRAMPETEASPRVEAISRRVQDAADAARAAGRVRTLGLMNDLRLLAELTPFPPVPGPGPGPGAGGRPRLTLVK